MVELFTSTGKGFDSMIKFNSTIKFKSNYLPQRAKVLTQRLHAFLSPRRANVTQWSNYLPQRAKVLTQRSNLTPQRANNVLNQQRLNGRKIL